MLFDNDTELSCFGGVDEIAYKFLVKKGVNMKKIFRFIILFAICLFLVVWGGALIKNAVLTNKYYDDFKDCHEQLGYDVKPDYFRVFNVDGDTAEVYYVNKNVFGDFVRLKRVDDQWLVKDCYAVWSKRGNADEVIWPYWWHFIYAGF